MPNAYLSATGAFTAFGSGIMLGLGWALLNNDRFKDAKDVMRTTLGGGCFVAGLYVWAPMHKLREELREIALALKGMQRAWLE